MPGGQTIIGSTSDNSGLEIRATSNDAATTGADIRFTAGNNGALETIRILNNGNVSIGGWPTPNQRLVLRSPGGTNEVRMSMVNNSGGEMLTLGVNPDVSTTMDVPHGGLSITSTNGIDIATSGTLLRINPGGNVGINEVTPLYRFHVFETGFFSTPSRAGYFWNVAHTNTTTGPITNAGVYGHAASTRSSGSNTLTNVGLYGLAIDADDGYGGVFELNSIDSFRVRHALQVVHSSSRQVVNGMGVGILLKAENSAGVNQVAGSLEWPFSNVTAGNESADFSVRLTNNGANAEKMRLNASGELNIENFTDQGSFTLQNTGAFYQNEGINTKVSTINGNTTIDGSYHFIKVDASSKSVTIMLPPAASVFVNNTGITYIFKRIDNATTNSVTILSAGNDTIDGGTSMVLTSKNEAKSITATGQTEWLIH